MDNETSLADTVNKTKHKRDIKNDIQPPKQDIIDEIQPKKRRRSRRGNRQVRTLHVHKQPILDMIDSAAHPRGGHDVVRCKRKRRQRSASRQFDAQNTHGVDDRGHVRRKRKLNNSHVVIFQETNVSV